MFRCKLKIPASRKHLIKLEYIRRSLTTWIGKVYLDHGGTTVYSNSLIHRFSEKLMSNLYGNPHSESDPAALSGQEVDKIREQHCCFSVQIPNISISSSLPTLLLQLSSLVKVFATLPQGHPQAPSLLPTTRILTQVLLEYGTWQMKTTDA
jgi:hypothetical protein